MADTMADSPVPRFIEGDQGRLFSVWHLPANDARACMLFIPPFGEELNRCRHLVAEQARRFSDSGIACLILDLYGTGDSEGETVDASWEIWHRDVLAATRWISAALVEKPVLLWGLRLGGLLALDVAAANPGLYSGILLWQPVTNGKTYITQVLRQRVAALASSSAEAETTKQLRERLAAGESLDVGGYTLGSRLTADIDGLKLSDMQALTGCRIAWLEQSQTGEPSPAATKGMQQLTEQGNEVTLSTFSSPAIWQLVARADMSDLYQKTLELELP